MTDRDDQHSQQDARVQELFAVIGNRHGDIPIFDLRGPQMGQYRMVVEGLGSHHNTPPVEHDAERMLADFVRQLLAANHFVRKATFEVVQPPPRVDDVWEAVRYNEGLRILAGERPPAGNIPIYGDPNA